MRQSLHFFFSSTLLRRIFRERFEVRGGFTHVAHRSASQPGLFENRHVSFITLVLRPSLDQRQRSSQVSYSLAVRESEQMILRGMPQIFHRAFVVATLLEMHRQFA